MNLLAAQGFEAWIEWLGVPYEDRARLLRKAKALPIEFEKIGTALFHPPNANTIDLESNYERADTDRLMISLAERLGVKPEAFWPPGRPYAVCITHDIDRVMATVQRLKRFAGTPFKALATIAHDSTTAVIPALRQHNPFFNFKRMQELERDWGIRSASYVLYERRRLWKALRSGEWQHVIGVYSPKQIYSELLAYERAGNEVGIHASFDSWKNPEHLKAEVQKLRTAGIRAIEGGRTHYLNFDPVATPSAYSASGLKYDSTMGYNFRSGFRVGSSFPYQFGPVLELPFQAMDSSSRFQYAHYLERKIVLNRIHDEVRRMGGLLVVNWHTHVMNAKAYPREVDLLKTIVDRAKEYGAWIALPGEVAKHWTERTNKATGDLKVKLNRKNEPAAEALIGWGL